MAPGRVLTLNHPAPRLAQEGTLYNMNDGRKTLQNVFALDLFDNVQVGRRSGGLP